MTGEKTPRSNELVPQGVRKKSSQILATRRPTVAGSRFNTTCGLKVEANLSKISCKVSSRLTGCLVSVLEMLGSNLDQLHSTSYFLNNHTETYY